MTCNTCTETDTHGSYPFVSTRSIASESHYGIDVAVCKDCGNPAVIYWVEIYEDLLDYACSISPDELDNLLRQDAPSSQRSFTLELLRSRQVAYGTASRGFFWLSGTSAMLDGPPW